MASLTIRGVPISFPFEPYELQKNYMEKVIECLQGEVNGVLESPTGTGKTLSLLCSSLAWLTLKKAQIQAQKMSVFGDPDGANSLIEELNLKAGISGNKTHNALFGAPKIIYSSRTHSQLSQAMQELKRTSYSHMKASVLGSRDMMCINPDVMKEESQTAKVHMCRMKVQTNSCHFYNRIERRKEDPLIKEQSVVDIEDIVTLGKKLHCCPYYLSKEMKQQSDIVFMPYNYLIDPRVRKALGIELSNNIIIFDEAHNIERICEESASLQIKSTDITLAIEEVTEVMRALSDDNASFFSADTPKDFTAEDLCIFKEILLAFEKVFDEIPVNNEKEGQTYDGKYLFEILEKSGIKNENHQVILALIEKLTQFLSTPKSGPFQRKGNGLQTLEDMLRIVFMGTSKEFKEKVDKCFKVHITIEEQKSKTVDTWISRSTKFKKGCRVLNYWCFSPGFGMNTLMAQGVRCIILTSGTLAPLKPLISELELKVDVFLENPHIVTAEQICVKVITNGPDSELLQCTYQNRDNPRFISSLGSTIVNVSRHIPEGLLIFFPSYPIMFKCQQAWQESNVWASISNNKQIFVEPRQKEAFSTAMLEYYAKIKDPNSKGAIFMAVCRGKVAEGLDFADMNGRAVIIIGLPYPPLKDPRVILKKKYLDICNRTNKEYLRGDEWYNLEASRAVNQAVGRVIRHRNDFGAIILLDSRYGTPRIKQQMSLWLRDHIKVIKNFGEVIRDLRSFYKNAENKYPVLKKPKTKQETVTQVVPELDPIQLYRKRNSDNVGESSQAQNSSNLVTIHTSGVSEKLAQKSKKIKLSIVPNPKTRRVDDHQDIKEYLAMVKKTLSAEDFQSFIKAMADYRDSGSFATLHENLDSLFLERNSGGRFLIHGLHPYINEQHRVQFNEYLEKIE